MKRIKSYLDSTIVITLLTILWIFFMDGVDSNDWRNFEIIGSVFIFILGYSFIRTGIKYLFEFNFLFEIFVEYMVLIAMYLLMGAVFNWYNSENWYIVFIYVTPIYMIAYFFNLFEAKRQISYINRKLEEKQIKTKNL